jgi:hypothetical protein
MQLVQLCQCDTCVNSQRCYYKGSGISNARFQAFVKPVEQLGDYSNVYNGGIQATTWGVTYISRALKLCTDSSMGGGGAFPPVTS